jgi:hypothetical protein
MHLALIVPLAYSLFFPPPQTELWQKVRPWSPVNLKSFSPSPAQLIAVKKALAARVQLDNTPCAAEDNSEWTENLEFEELPASATQQIVLVSAGSGCARGAQWSHVGNPLSGRKIVAPGYSAAAFQRMALFHSTDNQSRASRFSPWLAHGRRRNALAPELLPL